MSHTGGRITSTVGIVADLQAVLGTSENRVSYLCTHSNIKRCAKYKPVDYNTQGQRITNAQRAAVNYGIVDIPVWSRLTYMSSFLFGDKQTSAYYPSCGLKTEYFNYRKPQGGSTSPYRLADFINYDHDVPSDFIYPITSNTISIEADGLMQIIFPKGFVNDYVLRYSDLIYDGQHNIGSMYFGIIMQKGSTTIVATQNNAISTLDSGGASNFVIGISTGSIVGVSWEGTWHIYPIASSQTIGATTSISAYDSGTYICLLPYHNQGITASVKYSEVSINSHHGYKDSSSSNHTARFNFQFSNSERAGMYRNIRLTVTLCDANGNTLNNWSGGSATQTISTGTNGSISANCTITQIWSSNIYYKAEIAITDSLTYKRSAYVGITGPIQIETPTPDI